MLEDAIKSGVVRADPKAVLSQDDKLAGTNRLQEIELTLEKDRAAKGYGNKLSQLNEKLGKVDNDNALIDIASKELGMSDRVGTPVVPVTPPVPVAPVVPNSQQLPTSTDITEQAQPAIPAQVTPELAEQAKAELARRKAAEPAAVVPTDVTERETRKQELGLIHKLSRDNNLNETQRRAVIKEVTGQEFTRTLDQAQRQAVIQRLQPSPMQGAPVTPVETPVSPTAVEPLAQAPAQEQQELKDTLVPQAARQIEKSVKKQAILSAIAGDKSTRGLQNLPNLNVVSKDDAPKGMDMDNDFGMYDPESNTISINQDLVAPEDAAAVVLHEVAHPFDNSGKKIGRPSVDRIVGEAARPALVARVQSLARGGNPVASDALTRATDKKTGVLDQREVLSYFIEEIKKARDSGKTLGRRVEQLVKDVVAAVKGYLQDKGIGKGWNVTEADVMRAAEIMAKTAVKEGLPKVSKTQESLKSTNNDQTNTPAFKEWFGDSKVVDENGNPLVVYHGTQADFNQFTLTKKGIDAFGTGFYFTTSPKEAADWAVEERSEMEGENIIPAYLSLQNPKVLKLGEQGVGEFFSLSPEKQNKILSDGAHDGAIYLSKSGKILEVMVRRAGLIKSATGNSGEFSKDNPSILKSSGATDNTVDVDLFNKVSKGFDEALSAVVDDAPSDVAREIAKTVVNRIRQLQTAGFTFSLRVTEEGMALRGARGISIMNSAGLGDAISQEIVLNHPSNGDQSGTNYQTVLHELAHAATQASIRFAPEGSAAKKLTSLFNDVVREFNKRSSAGNMTPFEKKVFDRQINALANPDELLAWGLTNQEAQAWLASVVVDKRSLFSRLVDLVADALGIRVSETTALSELIALSDEILTGDIQPYIAEANIRGQSYGRQENTTDAPSWALLQADGRKVLWSDKDAALIQAKSLTGDPLVLLSTKEGITRVDIGSYTGGMVSPSRLSELRGIADGLRPSIAAMKSKRPAQQRFQDKAKESVKDLTDKVDQELPTTISPDRTILGVNDELEDKSNRPSEAV